MPWPSGWGSVVEHVSAYAVVAGATSAPANSTANRSTAANRRIASPLTTVPIMAPGFGGGVNTRPH